MRGHRTALFVAAAIVVALLLPVAVRSQYYMHVLIMCCINVLLASSLRSMMVTGQVSLGHAGFMSIGAYATGILTVSAGVPALPAIFLGALAAAAVAAIFAIPLARVKSLYFVMVTIFLAMAINQIFVAARGITGGTNGLLGIAPLGRIYIGSLSIDFAHKVPYYYFALVVVLLFLLLLFRFDRSYAGTVLGAIAQDEPLCSSTGTSPAKYKFISFCVACFGAGLAGGIFASYVTVITPDTFDLRSSIYVLIYVIVGGAGNFYGAIVGAVVFTIIPQLARSMGEYQPLLFAAAMYVVVFLVPGGLVNIPHLIRAGRNRTGALRSEVDAADNTIDETL